MEAFISILRAASQLQLQLVQQFKPFDVSHEQYNVLRILRGAGLSGRTCQQIADRLISHNPDVTRLINKLMKKKLVSRRRDAEDRRIVTTRITKNGEKLLEEIDDQFSQMESEPLGHMKKKELDQLIDLLERVREQGS